LKLELASLHVAGGNCAFEKLYRDARKCEPTLSATQLPQVATLCMRWSSPDSTMAGDFDLLLDSVSCDATDRQGDGQAWTNLIQLH
jgi:hypothetical protein